MNRLTITQRIKNNKTFCKNADSAKAMYCALRGDCGLQNRPTMQAIGKIVKRFEKAEMVINI